MANDEDDNFPPESERSSSEGREGKDGSGLSDAIRKIVTTGVSAAFMTEEAIRSRVSDLKLPKETLNVILQGTSKSKEQLMNRVTDEIVGIIKKIDFVQEASRFVEEHIFRVSAEIEVIRKDPQGPKSEPAKTGGSSGKSES